MRIPNIFLVTSCSFIAPALRIHLTFTVIPVRYDYKRCSSLSQATSGSRLRSINRKESSRSWSTLCTRWRTHYMTWSMTRVADNISARKSIRPTAASCCIISATHLSSVRPPPLISFRRYLLIIRETRTGHHAKAKPWVRQCGVEIGLGGTR